MPSRRLKNGDDPGVRTDGPWIAEFARKFCTLTKPPKAGEQFEVEPHEQAFLDDAFTFDDEGDWVYRQAVAGWPRKNGKSTGLAAVSLALGSSGSGEPWPDIPLSAGSRDQAGELFSHASAFVEANKVLSDEFEVFKTMLRRRADRGAIWRTAADGKLQHSLNPFVVLADELHAWVTPRQVELWNALKTAFGARDNFLLFVISTAGWDMNTILGSIYQAAVTNPLTERRPEMGSGGFVLKDLPAKLLVHWYGISADTTIEDLDDWAAANPASWRTRERIAEDLADSSIDASTKRRLYGNQWTAAKERWISDDMWRDAKDADADPLDPDPEWIESGSEVFVGADAAVSFDCSALGWAAVQPDGRVKVRCRVWSPRREAPHHVLCEGRIDNELVEQYVSDELAKRYSVREVAYDDRFFETESKHLADAGLAVFPVEPQSKLMREAIDGFYKAMVDGSIIHDGDPVLAAHVAAAAGEKQDRGWKVSKVKAAYPIDALIAVVLAHWRAVRGSEDVWLSSW